MALSWDQALAWRLRRHLLDPVGACSVGDVVARLGAVPAYPETTPELAIALRRRGGRVGDVRRALDAGEVFKTFAFRGATHLLTPEEGARTWHSARQVANGSCAAGARPMGWRRETGRRSVRPSGKLWPSDR